MSQGYGLDTWCTDTLRPGKLARGRTLVAQALFRRMITPRGTLRGVRRDSDESTYGFDVAAYLGAAGPQVALLALPGLVQGELLKDDRVSDVSCAASLVQGADGLVSITLVISVLLVGEDSTFDMTVSVSAARAILIGAP